MIHRGRMEKGGKRSLKLWPVSETRLGPKHIKQSPQQQLYHVENALHLLKPGLVYILNVEILLRINFIDRC